MGGAAGDKRPAPVEPEEGGGAAKRQKRGEGGLVAKPGNGVPQKEQASRNKVKDNKEGGGAPKKQRSKCPHQRERSKCKECGGSSICPHQRRRNRCKECRVSGKRFSPVVTVEAEEGGVAAKKQRRVKLQATSD